MRSPPPKYHMSSWRRRTLSCFMRIDSHHMEIIMKLNHPTQDTAASNARRLDDGSLAAHR